MGQDEVQIKGFVTIWQGDEKDKRFIAVRAENHFVDAGLKGLVSALVCKTLKTNSGGVSIYAWSYLPQIYLGSDVETPTVHEMSALTSPIGASPGTAPSTISGAARTNPSSGKWRTSYIAIWYAGSVSGTVGELGLYLRPFTEFTAGWDRSAYASYSYDSKLVSRLSHANSDLSSFAIDPSKSLTVQWDLEVSFA
jgi:hypothetical protein